MRFFILLISLSLFPAMAQFEINFGTDTQVSDWRPLNDGVMGGLSVSLVEQEADFIRFSGQVSLENNGGFASIRSPFRSLDLSKAETVEMRIRAPKGQFALTMETERVWFRPYYKHPIELSGPDWQTVRIPLEAFHAYQVGRKLPQTLNKAAQGRIIRLGIITDFKQARDFELEIDYIRFVYAS